MAFLNNKDLDLSGSIGNLSVYKVEGIEKSVVRTKGGADKKKIMRAPEFELTRQNASEYSACGIMGGAIRRSMLALRSIADHNFTPKLNALSKIIQHLDTEGARGQRNVYLSRHKDFLTGFSLTRKTTFENIVNHPLSFNIDRESAKATVTVPALMPGINFMIPKQYPVFRFVVTLGAVADRVFNNKDYQNVDMDESKSVTSDWFHAAEGFQGLELSLQLKYLDDIGENTTLVLAVGIEMGVPLTPALVKPIKRAGAAKIIGVA